MPVNQYAVVPSVLEALRIKQIVDFFLSRDWDPPTFLYIEDSFS